MRKKLNSLISMVMVVMMLAVPFAVKADDPQNPFTDPVEVLSGTVTTPGADPDGDHVMDGDLSVTNDANPALTVIESRQFENVQTSDFEITGSVNYDGSSSAVYESAGSRNTEADVIIGNDLIAENANTAAFLYSNNNGIVNLDVGNDIKAVDSKKGVSTEIAGTEGEVNLNVGGDLSLTGKEDHTADEALHVENNGTFTATIGGNVSVTSEDENHAIVISAGAGSTTDIVVEETISSTDAAIVLEQEAQMGDGGNVQITVWQIETQNENDALVISNNEQDPEAEAAIQYIIKVADDSKDYITGLDGTTRYKDKYDVAHETNKVVLKLNIPEGYEISTVSGEKATVLRDENGNYYLEVPRGGGVLLTLKVNKKATAATVADTITTSPTSTATTEPETPKGHVWGDVLVTLFDSTGMIKIEFMKDGTFRMTPNEGEISKGHFWFAGKLINLAKTGDENQAVKIMLNEASNLFEFMLGDAAFAMKENEVKKLASNRLQQ